MASASREARDELIGFIPHPDLHPSLTLPVSKNNAHLPLAWPAWPPLLVSTDTVLWVIWPLIHYRTSHLLCQPKFSPSHPSSSTHPSLKDILSAPFPFISCVLSMPQNLSFPVWWHHFQTTHSCLLSTPSSSRWAGAFGSCQVFLISYVLCMTSVKGL